MALAQVLLARYGVLTREAVHAEGISGGFAAVYDVLKAMEESARARRGYFVAGLGATQFALPGAEERLRGLRDAPDEPQTVVLAATDPANAYGAMLPWPSRGGDEEGARPQRAAGAHVVLVSGQLVAWLGRGEQNLLTYLPAEEPERSRTGRALANALAQLVDSGRQRALLISRVDGEPVQTSPLAPLLVAAGFSAGHKGYLKRPPVDALGLRLRAPMGPIRGPLGPDLSGPRAPAHARVDAAHDAGDLFEDEGDDVEADA
jgi:ATP-dependent Lhr-like helicase